MTEERTEEARTGAGPKQPKRSCYHDSTRADGKLDTHCLRCGADGYWIENQEYARVQIHPSGKVLIDALMGPKPDAPDETASPKEPTP